MVPFAFAVRESKASPSSTRAVSTCNRFGDSAQAPTSTRRERRDRRTCPVSDSALLCSTYSLSDAEHVALAVPEPSPSLADALARIVPFDLRDAIHGLEARQVVLLKHHATRPKHGNSG